MPFPVPATTIYGGWTQKGEQYADLDTRFNSFNTKLSGLTCDSVADDFAKLNTLVNTTMQPNGGRLDIVGVPRVGTSMAIPANVEVFFVGTSYIAPDVGVTLTISNFIRAQRKIFGGGGQIKFGVGQVQESLPLWFGAVLDGVADDTAPFISAIKAPPSDGVVVQFVGKMKLTGNGANISAAINGVKSFCLEGRNAFSTRGNNSPPQPMASIVYCKTLTDYFYKKSGTICESWALRHVAFDGSDGGGTALGSTTCPGIYATVAGNTTYNLNCWNVCVTDLRFAHNTTLGAGATGRAVWDLDTVVWGNFDFCVFAYCENGRCFFTDSSASMFRCARTELTALREAFYHRNSGNVIYDACVIESCTVAGASYNTDIFIKNPWWENCGITGSVPTVATGLAPRNHGLVYGAGVLDGAVNCYFSALGGSSRVEDAHIQGFGIGATILAWFECLGTPNGIINGGYFYLNGKKATGTAAPLFSTTMQYGTPQRDLNMKVEVWDNWGSSSGSVGQGLFVSDTTPARCVDMGAGLIALNDGSAQFMRIQRGNLIGDVQPSGYSNVPAAAAFPKGNQWIAGDRIDFVSSAGIGPTQTTGAEGVICYVAGTVAPGWRLRGIVHAVGGDIGDGSGTLVLFGNQEIVIFNTPLTAARTLTLPAPATLPVNTSGAGLKYTVVRTALCTGAFNLNINRSSAVLLKALAAAGSWADVEYSGVVNDWILTKAGTL